MIIQNDSLTLRPGPENDPEISKMLEDQEILDNLSERHRYIQKMPQSLYFRIEAEGMAIGQIVLTALRWYNHKAEISLFLASEHQSKGYGKLALQMLVDYAFRKMNLYRLEAEIMEYNKSSIALFEKLGFVREGRLREARFHDGRYYDILRYGLLQREYLTHREPQK